jgi:DNA-binding response OmpR family regulator
VFTEPPRVGQAPLVLIADDDPDILTLVRYRLDRGGYRTLTATNGRDALALALEHRPDVAVLDVMMPELSGIEVTRALRAQNIPILVLLLTARVREEDVTESVEAGADAYVTKPFSPQELEARLAILTGRG